MKKILIILPFLFLLSGCHAEYRVHISSKNIQDNLFIYDSIENIDQLNSDDISNTFLTFEGFFTGFKKEFVNTDRRKIGYHYTYELPKDDFSTLSLTRPCYTDFQMDETKEEITIQTSPSLICFEEYKQLEDVSIILTSDYEQITSNADEIKKNEHIWHITKENYQNKPLEIHIQKNKIKKSSSTIWIVPIIIILILIIFIIGTKQKKRKYTE